MRRLFGLVLLSVSFSYGGCHMVSDQALHEAHVGAAVADGVLGKWDGLADEQKKKAVWKLARGQYSVLNSADSTPIPDQYLTGPRATETAPVASPAK